MSQSQERKEAAQADKAWMNGDYETGRRLYAICVKKARAAGDRLPPSFYLCQWANMEACINNRDAFGTPYQQALSLEANAPMVLLWYARELWTKFKDNSACIHAIERLESLLYSDRWDKTNDISRRAYAQKIETLRARLCGEPGGPLWP